MTTLAVLVASKIFPREIHAADFQSLMVASLLLGVCNAVLRPILIVLAFPAVVLSLGLFMLVINASLLYLVSAVVRPFVVESFWAAIKGGIVISVVTFAINLFIGKEQTAPQANVSNPATQTRRTPGTPPKDDGGGPIIDV